MVSLTIKKNELHWETNVAKTVIAYTMFGSHKSLLTNEGLYTKINGIFA